MKKQKNVLPLAVSLGVGAVTYFSVTNHQSKGVVYSMVSKIKNMMMS